MFAKLFVCKFFYCVQQHHLGVYYWAFDVRSYFSDDVCGTTTISVTSDTEGLLCDGNCASLSWFEYPVSGTRARLFYRAVASIEYVGAYTATRTKGSYSEDLRFFICDIEDQDDDIITDPSDLDGLYVDEECMVNNQATDKCIYNSTTDGVYQFISIPIN